MKQNIKLMMGVQIFDLYVLLFTILQIFSISAQSSNPGKYTFHQFKGIDIIKLKTSNTSVSQKLCSILFLKVQTLSLS